MPIRVYDFFSGCGGTSAGLRQSGCIPAFGIDNDHDSAETFRHNFPEAIFWERDIREVMTEELGAIVNAGGNDPKLFCGCAPCQPFSKQNKQRGFQNDDAQLLTEFGRFVAEYLPEYLFIENVPGMQKVCGDSPLTAFTDLLAQNGYHYETRVINFQALGVPQRRHRLIILASTLGPVAFPIVTHGTRPPLLPFSSVREWISDLPPVNAGEVHPTIPNHVAAALSELNLRRIGATPIGGDRRDWNDDLVLECHKGEYKGHTDVYGRLRWDKSSGSLTTRCNSLSNGRFGHPEQNRAITIREAACLQTFPRDFIFQGNMNSCARQIGNAVPVLGARRFGEIIIDHWQAIQEINDAIV